MVAWAGWIALFTRKEQICTTLALRGGSVPTRITAHAFDFPFIHARPFFILSPVSGLAYLQVPKAACSSIQAALLALEKPELHQQLAPGWSRNVGELHTREGLFDTATSADAFLRFTFVRHPFRRLVSHYRNQVKLDERQPIERRQRLERELGADGFVIGMSFTDYLRLVVESPRAGRNRHVRPQVELVMGERGLNVDFIGRVEEIERGWKLLQRLTAAQLPGLARLNQASSICEGEERTFLDLDRDLRAKLACRYADDFRIFGYSPDTVI